MDRQLNREIREYQNLTDERKIGQVQLLAQSTFDKWSLVTWVRFTFVYTNNELNRKHKRVGKAAGMRIGTRNLALIPASDAPKGGKGNYYAKAYYDVTRANASVSGGISSGGLTGEVTGNDAQPGQWRSFRPNTFTIMTELWSFEKQAWISKVSDYYRKAKRI
jgi:hypothetical protein